MIEGLKDQRRKEPDFVLPEREMLEHWLEFHRTTLLPKCEGLDDASRKALPVATSKLSLHGLVRHMSEVERTWFRGVRAGEPDPVDLYAHNRGVRPSERACRSDPRAGRRQRWLLGPKLERSRTTPALHSHACPSVRAAF
jgi:hypothetical protein